MRQDAGDRRAQQQQFAAPGRSRRAHGRAGPADRAGDRHRLGLARPAATRSALTAGASAPELLVREVVDALADAVRRHRGRWPTTQPERHDLQAAARAGRLPMRRESARRSRFSPTARAAAIPGPGRLGGACFCARARKERELSGGEPLTTNNRMELMAAIEALEGAEEAMPGPALTPTASTSATASPAGSTAGGERLADLRQEAGQECRAVAGAGRRDRAAPDRMALGQGPQRPSGE